jgi:glutamate racemase
MGFNGNRRRGVKKTRGRWTATVLGIIASGALAACQAASPRPATFADAVRERPDVTIVVTDSGLGGLSVVAELAARLPASGMARSARIVFVNALLDDAIGYNNLKNEADKLRVFDAALTAMERHYKPDLLLVACNTLSVFYDKTEHARTSGTPAVGIVGMGADLIARQFDEKPGATALVFATRGTIDSDAHRRLLVQKGYPSERIVPQPCHRLAGSIERGAGSDETVAYIQTFVSEAVSRLPSVPGPLIVSLNCTHYGYARSVWEETFSRLGYPGVTVIDPNPLMAELVLKEGGARRYPSTRVTVEVVSKVPIGEDVRKSLGSLLRQVSPSTADALAGYRHEPGLFSVTIDPSAIVN